MTSAVKVLGEYRDIDTLSINVSGQWKSVEKAWVKVDNSWQEWYESFAQSLPKYIMFGDGDDAMFYASAKINPQLMGS